MPINIRLANFETRSPILLEVQVEGSATLGALRNLIQERMMDEDHVLMRVFRKLYIEIQVGQQKRFFEIDESDASVSVSSSGITDECVLYLEGPMIQEGNEDIGKALAMMVVNTSAAHSELANSISLLTRNLVSLTDLHHTVFEKLATVTLNIKDLEKKIEDMSDTLAANQAQQTKILEHKLQEQITAQSKLTQQVSSIATNQQQQSTSLAQQSKLAEATNKANNEVANKLLARYPSSNPLKAFWEALHSGVHSDIAMAVLTNSRCGIEAKAAESDGPMLIYLTPSFKPLDINCEGMFGATPLIIATCARRLDVMKSLLAAGANAKAVFGTYNLTALHVAAYVNDSQAIELLVAAGASPLSTTTNFDNTPLHSAARFACDEAIVTLKKLGANLNAKNSDGQTPLERFQYTSNDLAVSQSQKERIRALLTN